MSYTPDFLARARGSADAAAAPVPPGRALIRVGSNDGRKIVVGREVARIARERADYRNARHAATVRARLAARELRSNAMNVPTPPEHVRRATGHNYAYLSPERSASKSTLDGLGDLYGDGIKSGIRGKLYQRFLSQGKSPAEAEALAFKAMPAIKRLGVFKVAEKVVKVGAVVGATVLGVKAVTGLVKPKTAPVPQVPIADNPGVPVTELPYRVDEPEVPVVQGGRTVGIALPDYGNVVRTSTGLPYDQPASSVDPVPVTAPASTMPAWVLPAAAVAVVALFMFRGR